ncbi:putative RNA-directed DNA polymerase [Helianthus annuus]|nr:putative RNA-directed DNA polymerase [Helianthus annuus]
MVATDGNPSSNPDKQPLHPAYTVTNITQKIRTLDGKKVTYSSWVKLFKLHLRAYKVLSHIDDTTPPAKTDPSYPAWSELDALILQWIYSTISDELLARVLDTDSTARAAWLQLQEIFLNNKHARAVTLETKFTNTTLSSCSSFSEYCQTLKDIATQLKDVDQPVTDRRLVIRMVRGLPPEYDMIAAIINKKKPTWDEARGMIEDEMDRHAARTQPSRESALVHTGPQQTSDTTRSPYANESALVHTGPQQTSDTTRSPYANGYKGKNYDPAKAARGCGSSHRGGRHNPTRSPTTTSNPHLWPPQNNLSNTLTYSQSTHTPYNPTSPSNWSYPQTVNNPAHWPPSNTISLSTCPISPASGPPCATAHLNLSARIQWQCVMSK